MFGFRVQGLGWNSKTNIFRALAHETVGLGLEARWAGRMQCHLGWGGGGMVAGFYRLL